MKTDLMKTAKGHVLAFWCPACRLHHMATVTGGADAGWTWNGDRDHPTLTPSLRVSYNGEDAGSRRIEAGDAVGGPPATCHFYLTDGVINYLADSTHSLAGQQVPLEDLP